jgi:hypothetical protein
VLLKKRPVLLKKRPVLLKKRPVLLKRKLEPMLKMVQTQTPHLLRELEILTPRPTLTHEYK